MDYLTGKVLFEKNGEQLEVYTANRTSLEHALGVDLIYINLTKNNVVMVQYKMLELNKDSVNQDWVYYPDEKLEDELDRMNRFNICLGAQSDEYRLNQTAFYLKFVKRNASLKNGAIIIPIDHYKKFLNGPKSRGPKNGVRISYNSLKGQYLRQGPFLGLIQSGYIGSYHKTTEALKVIIDDIVEFLNGDPDQPVIIGRTYHAVNMPPGKLPASKTQTTLRTQTYKGAGFNEVRLDDAKDQQEVFIHAQKDMNTKILNDETVDTQHDRRHQVGNDAHLTVKNEYSENIKANRYTKNEAEEHHLTQLDRKTQIIGNEYKTVGMNEHTKIKAVQSTEAGMEIHLKSGMNIIIDGELSLTLTAGRQHIIINSMGIFSSVPILLGGAPVGATPATPLSPLTPPEEWQGFVLFSE